MDSRESFDEAGQARLAIRRLLHTLPDLEASPETWTKIEAALSRRSRTLAFWIRSAAAASIGVAVLSFLLLYTASRSGPFPVAVETHQVLSWNTPFRADRVLTLSIPDVGTLKVNQGASLRFRDARTVLLESGEVFADIVPAGRGFEIRSGETTARVHGTRFGVSAPSTVYVVEGRVEVSSPRGRHELGPDQAWAGAGLVAVTADEYIRWLNRYERSTVRLTLDPRDRTTITPGAPLKWTLLLETDALAPLYLEDPGSSAQFLYLTVNGTAVNLDPSRLEVKAARVPNGRIRLDVSHPCAIECAVDPSLFREKGRVTVRGVFTSGTERAWTGTVESKPIIVEVR